MVNIFKQECLCLTTQFTSGVIWIPNLGPWNNQSVLVRVGFSQESEAIKQTEVSRFSNVKPSLVLHGGLSNNRLFSAMLLYCIFFYLAQYRLIFDRNMSNIAIVLKLSQLVVRVKQNALMQFYLLLVETLNWQFCCEFLQYIIEGLIVHCMFVLQLAIHNSGPY